MLNSSDYRIYDTHSGRLLFERIGDAGWTSYLSPDGLLIATEKGNQRNATFQISEARSGKVLRQIVPPHTETLEIELGDFVNSNIFIVYLGLIGYFRHQTLFFQISDGKQMDLPSSVLNRSDAVTLIKPKTGKTTTYIPPRGAYLDIAVSPDRKWLYTVDNHGDIFRFPSR